MVNHLLKHVLNFFIFGILASAMADNRMNFNITKTWNNEDIDHDPISLTIYTKDGHMLIEVKAPYFNDPPPNGSRGKPFLTLWNYEVVEAFFLGEDERYLELEFSPHGQHLVLFLAGRKNALKMCLPLDYVSAIRGEVWGGSAKVPMDYFPKNVNRFNAYAIHGVGPNRVYESLFPVPNSHFTFPDFHRLEFFRFFDFSHMLTNNQVLSQLWKDAIQDSREGKEPICSDD